MLRIFKACELDTLLARMFPFSQLLLMMTWQLLGWRMKIRGEVGVRPKKRCSVRLFDMMPAFSLLTHHFHPAPTYLLWKYKQLLSRTSSQCVLAGVVMIHDSKYKKDNTYVSVLHTWNFFFIFCFFSFFSSFFWGGSNCMVHKEYFNHVVLSFVIVDMWTYKRGEVDEQMWGSLTNMCSPQ